MAKNKETAPVEAESVVDSTETPTVADSPIVGPRALALLKMVRDAQGEHQHQEARRLVGLFMSEIGA